MVEVIKSLQTIAINPNQIPFKIESKNKAPLHWSIKALRMSFLAGGAALFLSSCSEDCSQSPRPGVLCNRELNSQNEPVQQIQRPSTYRTTTTTTTTSKGITTTKAITEEFV
jgi:hypothetical protein